MNKIIFRMNGAYTTMGRTTVAEYNPFRTTDHQDNFSALEDNVSAPKDKLSADRTTVPEASQDKLPVLENKKMLAKQNEAFFLEKMKRLPHELRRVAFDIRCKTDWIFLRRKNQKPPPGKWMIWLILAGRGFGKTRTGAETLKLWINKGFYKNIALIASTINDAREVMIEGKSGLIQAFKDDKNKLLFEPSKRKITWQNGATAYIYSSENYEKLRGPEFDLIWMDELAKFEHPEETFDQAMLTLRIGARPRMIITTTPKPIPIIRKLMDRKDTVLTKGTTYDNKKNLSQAFIDNIKAQFENTELGAQEIYAEVLEPQHIYLWDKNLIKAAKVNAVPPREFLKKVISIDPAVTTNNKSDETGIIMAGIDERGIIYILDDFSTKEPANNWCDFVIAAYYKYDVDEVIVETNAGGDLTEQLIHVKDPCVQINGVFATRGKILRAEPIVPLYKNGMVKHSKTFEKLESQMMNYVSNSTSVLVQNAQNQKSPDRMDALVWAVSDLHYYYEHMPKITLL